MIVTRLQIGEACPRPGAYPMVSSSLAHAWQFHSFIGVNPLQTTWLEHGIVSGRVALLLRSAEIQPAFERFSDWTQHPITPPLTTHTQLCVTARGWVMNMCSTDHTSSEDTVPTRLPPVPGRGGGGRHTPLHFSVDLGGGTVLQTQVSTDTHSAGGVTYPIYLCIYLFIIMCRMFVSRYGL